MTNRILIAWNIIGIAGLMLNPSCVTMPTEHQRYKTLAAAAMAIDEAMEIYRDAYNGGLTTPAQDAEVKKAYEKVQAILVDAIVLADFDDQAPLPLEIAELLSDLILIVGKL